MRKQRVNGLDYDASLLIVLPKNYQASARLNIVVSTCTQIVLSCNSTPGMDQGSCIYSAAWMNAMAKYFGR